MRSKQNIKKENTRPALPYGHLNTEERIKVLANLIIDRVIEEEKLYKERLKTDPNAKRIFEDCQCEKCLRKRQIQSDKVK